MGSDKQGGDKKLRQDLNQSQNQLGQSSIYETWFGVDEPDTNHRRKLDSASQRNQERYRTQLQKKRKKRPRQSRSRDRG